MATPLPYKLPSGTLMHGYVDKETSAAQVAEWKALIEAEKADKDAQTDSETIAKYEKLLKQMDVTLKDLEAIHNMELPED